MGARENLDGYADFASFNEALEKLRKDGSLRASALMRLAPNFKRTLLRDLKRNEDDPRQNVPNAHYVSAIVQHVFPDRFFSKHSIIEVNIDQQNKLSYLVGVFRSLVFNKEYNIESNEVWIIQSTSPNKYYIFSQNAAIVTKNNDLSLFVTKKYDLVHRNGVVIGVDFVNTFNMIKFVLTRGVFTPIFFRTMVHELRHNTLEMSSKPGLMFPEQHPGFSDVGAMMMYIKESFNLP